MARKKRDIVRISSRSSPALAEPNFVVKVNDGLYYLAVAVLEYDEKKVTTREQKAGFARIRETFERAVSAGTVPCGMTTMSDEEGGMLGPVQTDPPHQDSES